LGVYDKVQEGGFLTGVAYFGIGAVGGVASLYNPTGAAMLVAAGNIGTDMTQSRFQLPSKAPPQYKVRFMQHYRTN
jgi:hypothetical protein